MKKKIKIIDKIGNKHIEKTVELRALDHLKSQQIHKGFIHKDKTKVIPRKRKYKDKEGEAF
jgi:hypothetical protein